MPDKRLVTLKFPFISKQLVSWKHSYNKRALGNSSEVAASNSKIVFMNENSAELKILGQNLNNFFCSTANFIFKWF